MNGIGPESGFSSSLVLTFIGLSTKPIQLATLVTLHW